MLQHVGDTWPHVVQHSNRVSSMRQQVSRSQDLVYSPHVFVVWIRHHVVSTSQCAKKQSIGCTLRQIHACSSRCPMMTILGVAYASERCAPFDVHLQRQNGRWTIIWITQAFETMPVGGSAEENIGMYASEGTSTLYIVASTATPPAPLV
jgi:hypothetical protein